METNKSEVVDESYSRIISFDISGRIFQTFSSTLLKNDSLFSSLLSNKIDTSKLKDKEGNFYFQRSQEGFEFILNCLRQNKYSIQLKKTSEEKIKFYQNEIKFYGLEKIIKINEEIKKEEKILKKNHYKKRKRGKPSNPKIIKKPKAPPIAPRIRIINPKPIPIRRPVVGPNPITTTTTNMIQNQICFFEKFQHFMYGVFSFLFGLTTIHSFLLSKDYLKLSDPIFPLGFFGISGIIWSIGSSIFYYLEDLPTRNRLSKTKKILWYLFQIPLSIIGFLFLVYTELKIKEVYFKTPLGHNWSWIYSISSKFFLKLI